jgi:aminomethyltransferase
LSRRSPLHEEHIALGGRLVDFAGWDMPLQFAGVLSEHTAVRERVGLFDVSHLGKLTLEGPGAAALLDATFTNDSAGLAPWRARYNLALTPEGGIIDDLFVYRRPDAGPDAGPGEGASFLVVPNAANAAAVVAALRHTAADRALDVALADAWDRWAILALQGPGSRAMADRLLPGANDLKLHAFLDADLAGVPVQVARTGYTGEYGFELFVPWAEAGRIWRLLLEAGAPEGIVPVGLGARDTLRLEMGYPLHGHEISLDTNPLEAGLDWTIAWAKASFTGKQALEAIRASGGPSRRLVGFVALGPGIPRAEQTILHEGSAVGTVTSGNHSVHLGRGIGLGYVPAALAAPGTHLEVDVRGRRLSVEVTPAPFVPRGRALVR